MIFYIKDENDKLFATCKYNKDTNKLVLEKSSFIKKSFDCSGCDAVTLLRQDLLHDDKLSHHNDDVYLLNEAIEFEDMDSVVCLVLGGRLRDVDSIIKNEFGESISQFYPEVIK